MNLNVQIHLFLNIRIAGGKHFNLCIGQGGFINILGRTHRGFARHNLTGELLLSLYKLIEICVKGLLRYIAVNIYIRI